MPFLSGIILCGHSLATYAIKSTATTSSGDVLINKTHYWGSLKSMFPFIVPALAFNPIFPLVISFLILTTTIVSHILNKYLESQAPSNKIEMNINNDKSHKPIFSNHFNFFSHQKAKGINQEKFRPSEPTKYNLDLA